MSKTIDEQIDEMLNLSTKAPGTNSPGTNPPGTTAPATQAVATEAPSTEAPGTKAPGTTAPATEAPEDVLDRTKRENDELRKKIDDLSGPKTKAPKTSAPSTDIPLSEVDFLVDIDLDEITRDPKEFNKLLNRVFSQGVNTSKKVLSETVLRSLPKDISDTVEMAITLKELSEKFYEDNEDLRPFKKVVKAVVDDVASEHPKWNHEKMLEESGTEARKRLELYREVNKQKPDKKKSPNLPRKKGQQRQTQQITNVDPLLAEIDAMNEVI